MKLNESVLKQMIKEELRKALREADVQNPEDLPTAQTAEPQQRKAGVVSAFTDKLIKEDTFAGAVVFEVNSKLFHNLTMQKRKGKHWRTYLEEDDCYAEIREWAKKHPKGKIVVRNECTGEMRYIKY